MAVGRSYLYSAGDDLTIKAWNVHDLTLHTSVDVSSTFFVLLKLTTLGCFSVFVLTWDRSAVVLVWYYFKCM